MSVLRAGTCTVAPISIAAASGCTGNMLRCSRRRFVSIMTTSLHHLNKKEGLGRGEFQFPNRDRLTRHHSQVRNGPWTMFFYGVDATKKPTAAPLGADNTYRSPFLCPQEENDPQTFPKKQPSTLP